ncbi:MAG: TonB-dependent receptor [Gammaproteobacteria bacterium]
MAACIFSVPALTAGTEYEFRIPATDASTGLNLFAKQSNTPLLFLNERVRDRQTNRVFGTYTIEEALELLLRDTGIMASINQNGVLTVSEAVTEEPNGGKEMKKGTQGIFAKLATLLVAVTGLNTAPAPVAAQTGTKVLEEVVVTAQKREESIQDVGIAITALDENRLVDARVNNIQDLQNMAPGLTIGESFGFSQIMIRGVGTDNPFAGGDPSVAMHVDGVVTGQSSAQLGSLFDMQRIEVLRGPQGTLYGRNTTGGSINVITNKPTEELSGYARLTGGNHELFQFEGAVGGPLTDQLRGRIATRIVERGGYGENLADGSDIDDASQQSVRGHLQWLATPDLDVLLSMEYHREDDRNYTPKFRAGSYPNAPVPALEPQPIGANRAADPRDIYSDVSLQNKREQWSITGTVNWQINNAYKLTSISNFQTFEKIPHQDFDMTDTAFYTQSEQFETDQFSQELQLHYDGNRINGLVGLYYYNEEIKSDNRLHQAIPVPPCGPATSTVLDYDIDDLCFHFRGAVNAEAAAVFANFNFAFTDNVTINLGGRYSYETRKGFTDRWFVPGMFDPSTFDPVTGTFDPAPITFADEGSFNDFTPRVGIEWNATEDLMVYATYTEGFKSGILLSGQTTPLLEPETVEAFELGMKGQFFNNRVQLNAAAFTYNYSDLQLGRAVPAGATGFTLVYENAAQAEVEGFELETSWLVTDQFRIDGSVTYLDAVFTDYVTTDPFDTVFFQLGLAGPPPGEQLSGNRLIQAPEWAWTLRGVYDFALPYNGWTGQAALEAAFKDDVYFTQFNHDALGQDSVTTLNANMKFVSGDGTWSLNLWGKNLTDEEIYTGTFIINGSRTNAGMLRPPRTFGATVGYNF